MTEWKKLSEQFYKELNQLNIQQLHEILDKWIAEDTLSQRSRMLKARLTDEDDKYQLVVEICNMKLYLEQDE